MKVTYCGDGPSFVASVDALITSLFAIFTERFSCLTLCLGERAREYVHAFRECVPLLLFPKLMSEAHSQEEVRHILPVAHRPENSSSAHLV